MRLGQPISGASCISARVLDTESVRHKIQIAQRKLSRSYIGKVQVSRTLGQSQGHIFKNAIRLPGHQFNLVSHV